MKILAIDSSALCGSVAVCDGEKLLGEAFINTTNTHSETLLPMVESVLGSTGLMADDIDMFACTTGPGSFTGIRIGVSLIKGLAFGKNKPCVGVSTLEATAYSLLPLKGIITAVSDARRCGLYNAVFESDGKILKRLTSDRVTLIPEIVSETIGIAKEKRCDLYFAGDGYSRIYSDAQKHSARVKETPELLKFQSAYSVARVAEMIYKNSENKDVFTDTALAAKYLRAAQAERERLERLGEKCDSQ